MRAVMALGLGVLLAGCAITSKDVAPSGAGTPIVTSVTIKPDSSTAAPSVAASAGATSGASASSCGADVAAAIKSHLNRTDVLDVSIIGGCHQASIATSLAAGDATAGLAICDKAAEVAYVGGISSITVQAANKHELAAGLKDSPCIGEP